LFKVEKNALISEIVAALDSGSVLLSGSPGIGKSWLVSMASKQLEKNRKILALAAEDYPVKSLDELRQALRFKNDILSVLAGFGPGAVLVVDGLDSLRSEENQRVFRALIKSVLQRVPTCVTLASIRTFDLQQSDELQELINTFKFSQIQVRPLSKEELAQVALQNSRFAEFLKHAKPAVRELIANPYMLRLALQLIQEGVSAKEVFQSESEVELLTKYWRRRVESRDDAEVRIAVLREVLAEMAKARMLSVPGSQLDSSTAAPTFADTYRGLKSDEILRESVTGRLFFEHSILFDYAGARLLFDEISIKESLGSDPAKAIFLRPSMSYFFQYLWMKSRNQFWDLAFELFGAADQYGERAAIIPAVTIFESSRTIEDLRPLLDSTETNAERGKHNVLRAIQAYSAFAPARRRLWLDFLDIVSRNLSLSLINEFLSSLSLAFQAPGLSSQEQEQIARTSRQSLLWGWELSEQLDVPRARQLSGALAARLLPIVASLFRTAPLKNQHVLSMELKRLSNRKSDSHEAVWLVHNLKPIIDASPKFAYVIYNTIFGHEETSDETTQIGTGAILRLSSNRRQDFTTAVYALQQSFPHFVAKSVLWATRAAVDAVNIEVRRGHLSTSSEQPNAQQFTFNYYRISTVYTPDYSEIWDQGHPQDESLNLLTHLLNSVLNPSHPRESDATAVRTLYREIAKRNQVAVVWKRILQTPFSETSVAVRVLFPLLTNPKVLSAPEIIVEIGNVLATLYASDVLTRSQKRQIEGAILKVADTDVVERYERPSAIRDRLLCQIPADRIATKAAREALVAATARNAKRENKPYFSTQFSQFAPSDEEWLYAHGADRNDPLAKESVEVSGALKEFERRFMNETPSLEECLAVEPAIFKVSAFLRKSNLDKVVDATVSGILAAALETVSKNTQLNTSPSLMDVTKKELLRLSTHSSPEPRNDSSDDFDKPFWGSPLARIEAAQGLMHLIWNSGPDQTLEDAVFRLADDSVPAVRFQIASNVNAFYKASIATYWKLVDHFVERETTAGVFAGLLPQLAAVAGSEPDSTVERLAKLLGKGYATDDNDYVLAPIANTLVGLATYRGTESAWTELRRLLQDPTQFTSLLGTIIFHLNSQVLEVRSEAITKDVRSRAIKLLLEIVTALNSILDRVITSNPFDSARYGKILKLTDSVTFRISIGLDADPDLKGISNPLDESQQRSAIQEYLPVLKELLSSRADGEPHLSGSAAYNLMKIFNAVLKFDPVAILELASRACRAASALGYHYDSMAIGETVKLIEKTLADHHEVLRRTDAASYVSQILDIFVKAGWSQAVQLVMRLDVALR
jgi:hypothetical protein